MIYIGFSITTPAFFFAIIFAVVSIIGLSISSSLTTVATVGVNLFEHIRNLAWTTGVAEIDSLLTRIAFGYSGKTLMAINR